MTLLQLVGFGGAVGAGARYLLGRWVPRALALSSGTMIVNAVCPPALVLLAHLGLARSVSADARAALTLGMTGGFMLLATFNHEIIGLIRDGRVVESVTLMAAAAAGCLAAGGLGLLVGRVLA